MNDNPCPDAPIINYDNDDEIMAELRRQRDEYLASIGYDINRLFEDIRKAQEAHPERIVSFNKRRSSGAKP